MLQIGLIKLVKENKNTNFIKLILQFINMFMYVLNKIKIIQLDTKKCFRNLHVANVKFIIKCVGLLNFFCIHIFFSKNENKYSSEADCIFTY